MIPAITSRTECLSTLQSKISTATLRGETRTVITSEPFCHWISDDTIDATGLAVIDELVSLGYMVDTTNSAFGYPDTPGLVVAWT